jgi:hypothetical protein
MKKTSFKRSAAIFSFLALGAYGIITACAWEMLGTEYSNFTPEVYADLSYAPLFFAPEDVFYGIGHDEQYTSRFNESITKEWGEFLNGKLRQDQLAFLLLNDSTTALVNSMYDAMKKGQKFPAPYQDLNSKDEKIRGFIEFMHDAKQIEMASTTSLDSWNYEEKEEHPVAPATVALVEKHFAEAKDPFLKNRYWFQAMKANFYSTTPDKVLTFFEKTKASVPQNILYYRGLSYVAGIYYRKKQYATSNYLFSIVFDKCPALRTVTTYNFHPQEEQDFQSALALAKSNDEKAALWALLGYYSDEETAIQQIYQLNPRSSHLDFLLTRLVNKVESDLNQIEFKSAAEYHKAFKEGIRSSTLQLVTSIAKEDKTAKPYLWHVASGYLNTLAGNQSVASQEFIKAESSAPKTQLSLYQIRLLKFINLLAGINKMDTKAEEKLLGELQWLYYDKSKGADENFRYLQALDWSRKYIAALYKAQQNHVMAELFNREETFYRTPADLEAMKAFLSKSNHTPWENMAIGLYDITLSDIYEYQAVMSAYAGKLDEAIAFMQQSDEGNVELLGNPFNGKIKDCHDCDHAAPQKVKYTKLSFLQKMKEMKTYVDNGQDVYNNSLLLGNAYYNITYHGNARVFYYGKIMNQYSNSIDVYYQPQLLSCATATQYYQKAFDATTNPEQKAKCAYMLAKCERNEFYNKKYYSSGDFYGDTDIDFLAWNGFKKLKTDYANTKYYKEVINECGYFRTYASGH